MALGSGEVVVITTGVGAGGQAVTASDIAWVVVVAGVFESVTVMLKV